MKMKKPFLLIITLVLIGFVLSTCRVHERCPAYGKADVKKVEKPV